MWQWGSNAHLWGVIDGLHEEKTISPRVLENIYTFHNQKYTSTRTAKFHKRTNTWINIISEKSLNFDNRVV